MSKLIKVTLAKDVDESKLKFPLIIQPKIDGTRAIVQDGKLYARSLKQHENKFVTQQYSNPIFNGLDGEMIVGNNPAAPDLCRNTSSALRTIEGEPVTTFWCFDYITEETKNLPYFERYEMLADKIIELNSQGCRFIDFVPSYSADNLAEYQYLRDTFLEQGYEGCIIRDPKAKYKQGRSSSVKPDLWRYKPWASAEIIVTNLVEEMQNNNQAKVNELGRTERSSHKENLVGKGTLGAIVGTLYNDLLDYKGKVVATKGTEITIATGSLTEKEKLDFWKNPDKIVGQLVTFSYMSYGLKDNARFAQFESIRSFVDM